jgi:hypothetical protein
VRIGTVCSTYTPNDVPCGVGDYTREMVDVLAGIQPTIVQFPRSQIRREGGILPLREFLVLSAICAHVRPQVIIEIGTFKGTTTLLMAMNSPATTKIYTLDLPSPTTPITYPLDIGSIAGQPYTVGECYKGTAVEAKTHQLCGDSADFDFTPFYSKADLVFIDGNHEYHNVRADTENAMRCLRTHGLIVWDDYHPSYGPGVMRALHEISKKGIWQILGTRFGVYVSP